MYWLELSNLIGITIYFMWHCLLGPRSRYIHDMQSTHDGGSLSEKRRSPLIGDFSRVRAEAS
jgi:hypothetical protein